MKNWIGIILASIAYYICDYTNYINFYSGFIVCFIYFITVVVFDKYEQFEKHNETINQIKYFAKQKEKIECLEKEILDFKRTIREKNLIKHFKK